MLWLLSLWHLVVSDFDLNSLWDRFFSDSTDEIDIWLIVGLEGCLPFVLIGILPAVNLVQMMKNDNCMPCVNSMNMEGVIYWAEEVNYYILKALFVFVWGLYIHSLVRVIKFLGFVHLENQRIFGLRKFHTRCRFHACIWCYYFWLWNVIIIHLTYFISLWFGVAFATLICNMVSIFYHLRRKGMRADCVCYICSIKSVDCFYFYFFV